MPIVIGLGEDAEWKDPLNLFGGEAPGLAPSTGNVDRQKPDQNMRVSMPEGMSERDWNDTVNTVIAEAAGEGDEGMAGVAHVIQNRSKVRGQSIGDVVRDPDQFTGYSKPGPKAQEAMRDPQMRARAENILRSVMAGEGDDPTGGADHYHADYVSPYWAKSMVETKRIGNHLYYNSKAGNKPTSSETAFVSENDGLGLLGPKGQFGDMLKGEQKSDVPNPSGKGLARLVREPEEKENSGGGKLNFVHPGQEKIAPQFAAILTDTSKAMGRDITINSGYRSPTHRVEAAKPGGPGEHSDGTASDISMKGMSEGERAKLVRELYSRGARRFITYKNSPDMLHVDMKDQTGKGTPWFMFDKSARNMPNAPAWFKEVAANPGEASASREAIASSQGDGGAAAGTAIVMDENYKAGDAFGLFSGTTNPLEAEAKATAQARTDAAAAEAQRIEQERVASETAANNRTVDARIADGKGRYVAVNESELPDWQKQWDQKNRSSGIVGDIVRRFGMGAGSTSQSINNLNRLIVSKLPGGDRINEALDGIDRWWTGKTQNEQTQESIDRMSGSLSPEGEAAREKKWWDEENKTLGPAWKDPRSYIGTIAESAPATIATMAPSGLLARGSFMAARAAGATAEAAAATAAKTATIAGGISEGLLGGADAALSVKQRIAELPREQLVASEAVKQLVQGGLSEDDAIKALSEDAQVQAMLTAGVITGAFGGMGDRALAKIIAEGVEGGIARRIGVGAAKGMVGEGIFEEAPQSAGQTIAENAAVARVKHDQDLTEGLGESVASGVAAGGAMGGGMGAVGGVARPAASNTGPSPEVGQAAPEPTAPVEPDDRGPLRRAADHGQQRQADRGAAANAGVPIDGRPGVKSTVRVEAEGVTPFMGTVEGYEGDEAVVVDSGSGEVYQVPLANLSEIAPPVADYQYPEKSQDGMPEHSADPALQPLPPMSAELTSEMPPRSEDIPATEKRPTRPQAGQRVIVNDPAAGRFSARIERYENGGTEAVVVDDEGKPYQVPLESMKVNGLTPAQVEQQDLERDPPIEREIGDAGPNSRKIGDKTVVLPDEKHAALYDLAREQIIAKKLGGTSQIDMDSVLPQERKRLANEFRIKVSDLATLADDYRYRAERAAKQAKSKLPVNMHAVNDRLLKQRQSALAKEAGEAPTPTADDGATWWDVDLTAQDRKGILEKAGVKRSERLTWAGMTPGIRKKLTDVRDAQRAASEDVETLSGQSDVSAKMQAIADEIGQDDGAVYPDHAEAMQADAAANMAATSPTNDGSEPTEAQKEAGNYKVGRLKLGGLDVSIENPAGSTRKGVSSSGKAWAVEMKSHYGYIRGTVGRDKDHIDVFVRPGTDALDDSSPIFVVDQKDPARGRFDEHKVMAGFDNEAQARAAYLENYTADWKGLGDITQTTLGDFKTWLKSGKTSDPFAPKWFASQEKAEGYVAKNKMGETHEVVQRGKRFEVLERARTTPAVRSGKGTELDPNAHPWSDVWGSDADAVSDALSRITSTNGGDTPISDAVKADVGNKELLQLIEKRWGEGGAGGNRYMIETRKGPIVTITLEKDEGNQRIVLRGKELADAIRKEFAVSLEDMKREAAAREEKVEAPQQPKQEAPAQQEQAKLKPKPAVSENKLFTEDAAAKARELLRKKLSGNTLNSGIDPELLQAGITLAGYHIEKGARTFAAYASAMLADLGEGARPYLRSWYMGVKYDPRASAFDGMSSAAEVEAADVNTFTGETNEPEQLDRDGAPALEGVSAEPVPGAESGRDAGRSTGDSSGADVSGSRPAGEERVPGGRGVADGEGELSPVAAGRQPGNRKPDADVAGSDERSEKRAKDGRDQVARTAAVPAQQRPSDYVITDADGLGEGGQKAKFRANVAAIELVKQLDEQKRPATRDEQAVLAKWVGWGGLRAAFPREDGSVAKGWEKEAAELKSLLTKEEYSAAESSTRNAHYTSPEIVDAAWSIAQRLGFKGGQVLEPSVGAGNFLGLMPGEVRGTSHVTGVELDRITGSIAKNLYPSANIQAPIGFEKLTVPNSYFDLAIGNPPFGSEKLYDKERTHLNTLSIHNFFFAKAIETLRPGGILAMVVTNRFLDGQSAAARNLIQSKADFIGAIRLPNDAFLKNAGTEVTTDIVILQRREAGAAPKGSDWLEVVDYRARNGNVVPLNKYFVENPDMMLGEFGGYGSMYGPNEPALIARGGQNTAAELAKAVEKLPQDIMGDTVPVRVTETVTVPETVGDVQVGTMFSAPDGSIHLRTPDHIGQPTSKAVDFANETAKERVAGMVRVRDAFAKLRRAQISDTASDQQIENLRKRLNTFYDAFVNKHGPINSDANKRLFRDDPTWPQISALEQSFDKGLRAALAKKTGEKPRAPTATKAAIFTRRTQQPYRRPTNASSAKDALATILNDYGRVNLEAMSDLYGKSQEAIVEELGSLIFKTPAGAYETADQYLSGNVKQKLAEAERAAEQDPEYRRNVNALRDVIPADIEAIDIDVKPGAPWLPANHVEDFIAHIAQAAVKPRAYYSVANAKWDLTVSQVTPAAQTLWGTDRAGVGTVLSAVMNGQTITISDRTSDGKSIVDQAATDAANEKVERVKAEWRKWLWQDDKRRDDLARLYNDTFNTDVIQQFDGSHLTLPGKVGDDIIELRPSQKNFIWRTLQSGTALADHTVGAGKTFAAIASVMEKRRTGQARKPMMVVPNHLVGQWAADFVRLYPGAKVLAATKQDFEKERRKRLFARIATGDWDAVIVAHSSFGRIGVDPNYEAKFIQQQMDDLEASLAEVRRETGQKSRNVAQLTKWRDNLKAKMERLLDSGRKDDGLTFDELGVDALYVDEAHEFKNLAYSTSMQRVAGLGNMAGSSKAADLYMKSRFILEKTGGNNLVFLTGTPLSNTMAEMYTVQRYLDEKALRAMGVAHFDAWARVFGEVVTDWELSPSGQYKLNSRFSKFVNVPELMQRYRSFADVITNDDIKAQLAAQGKKFPLPKVKGGKPTNIVVERSPDQAAYIGVGQADDAGNLVFPNGSLVWRAENLPKKAEKGKDNMLKVMSDARKAALDMRLIDPSYPDHPKSKIHRAANEMTRIYKASKEDRGTQLVFIDLSTPKKERVKEQIRIRDLMERAAQGDEAAMETLDNMSPDEFLSLDSTFSVYDDLKQKLVARGISESEIAFIHDANTEAQKEELFGKVRSGRVRFLFGSTAKMGAGTNVQNRLVALHHLDAPWRPSDLEQRDGRGIRQGNELYAADPEGFEIEILRYATKNTLDARQWQTIEAKARFIQQVRKGDMKTREIEDIAGEAANAAEMKAAASGNPLILEEMDTRRKLRQLEGQSIEHDREQHRVKGKIKSLEDEADRLQRGLSKVEADADLARKVPEEFAGTVGGQTFEKRKDFGAAIVAAMRKELIDKEGVREIGEYAGFKVGIDPLGFGRAFNVTLEGAREYTVPVDDASDVDAAGLAQRIMNTVKRLANQPAIDKERISEAKAQVPALQKQIGAWEGAQELADTAARHRRILDALKPQPKSAKTSVKVEAGDVDAPIANKRPDPVVIAIANDLQTVGIPAAPNSTAIFQWAKDTIARFGKSGHEYLMAVDDDGSVVEFGTAKKKAATGINNKLYGALLNPDRRLVVFHNHPSNSPLSVADISMMGMPGLHSVWAFGANGMQMRAVLTPEAEAVMRAAADPNQTVKAWRDTLSSALEQVDAFLRPLVTSGVIDVEAGNAAYTNTAAILAQKAGLIDISSNTNYDTSAIEGLNAKLDKLAVALKEQISDGTAGSTDKGISRRPARDVRHVAEVEGLARIGEPMAGTRSGPAGLSETGAPDYQRKERRSDKQPGRVEGVTQSRIVEELRGKLTDLQPALLKTIPLNYFSELARSNMTAVGDYLRVKRLMDAFRGKKHAEADSVAQDWLKYTRLGFAGKDKAKAQELADLMHDATLAGVDPAATDDETKALSGDDHLRKRFMALPPKGRELYVKVRDAYREQSQELDEILLDNVRKAQQIAEKNAEDRYKLTMQKIKDAGLTGIDRKNAEEDATSAYKAETTKSRWAAKARLTRMRIAFESSRVQPPYFPLGRFGRYFATVRDIDGRVLSFSKHETVAERDRMARELRAEYPAGKVEVGVMEASGDMRKAMDPRIVAEIEEILGGANIGGDVMDQIWQRYLESMPDLSTRKRFIHRKGTAGYSKDALRVFSSHMFHAAHQMARLKYGLELQELVNNTVDQAKESDDQTRAMTLANELSSRHKWVMNPTGSKVAQTMTSTAFVWYLAASPGAALVNMTQTVMLGLPILAAKFGGFKQAAVALSKASADSVAGKGSVVSDRLAPDERRAMDAFYESGLIDRTQSHDLAGVGETGVEYTPLRAKVMEKISWAFHRAEVWNREVTALAAYRMARAEGQNMSDAIDTAHDLTWKTHFDYSNSSRPAVLQNDFAKVALVFRQHNINMLYRVARDIHQSVKGETPQARREARYQLAGVMGMMAAMAGVTGTMGFSVAMMIAGAIFGDDDDPMAFEDQFKADVVDILGPQLGGVLLNGVPGHYLGIDLSSRIGMPDLWFRSPTRELQGKDEYQYWLSQSLGATVSLGEQLYTGFKVMTDDGDVARGIEMMAPKAVRDLMKAYRYSQDGVATIGKDQILGADQIDATDIVAQAMGFTPAKIAETWERNSALKNAETRVKRTRQALINRWAMATMAGDKEAAAEVLESIKRFNSLPVHAGFPIKGETLKRSIQTRATNAAKREDGVLIGNKALGASLRERLADPVYR
jgi:N12 class adenine-specific DNA methylase